MKKFLGVSLVAVLAVTPMMAQANVATVATNDTTVGVASTKYVKEAYNAMAVAVNSELSGKADSADLSGKANVGMDNLSNTGKDNIAKVGTYSSSTTYSDGTIGAAIKGKQDTINDLETIRSGAAKGATALQSNSTLNGANLTSGTVAKTALATDVQTSLGKADSAVQSVTAATEQMANGTISVDGTAVAVKGLGSAAYTASTAYDAAGAATTAKNAVETKLTTAGGANGYDIDAKSLKVQGTSVLTTGSSLDGSKITAGTVAKTALESGVQTSLNKADNAVRQVKVNGTALAEGATDGDVNITVTTGDATSGNGTIKVNGAGVSVYGLKSAAYTESSAYATSGQGTKADSAIQSVKINGTALTADSSKAVNVTVATGTGDGTIAVNGTDVSVKGLGSAAYTDSGAYATSAQGTKADNAATTIGTGTLSTTADTLIGAVNEVNSKVLTIYNGWNNGEAPNTTSTVTLTTPAS